MLDWVPLGAIAPPAGVETTVQAYDSVPAVQAARLGSKALAVRVTASLTLTLEASRPATLVSTESTPGAVWPQALTVICRATGRLAMPLLAVATTDTV